MDNRHLRVQEYIATEDDETLFDRGQKWNWGEKWKHQQNDHSKRQHKEAYSLLKKQYETWRIRLRMQGK